MLQILYSVCVILGLFVFNARSIHVQKKHVAKRSSESTWACHAGCKKFCLPSCKRSCCAPGAQPYQPGMFNQLLNYQESLPPLPMHPGMSGPPMIPPQQSAGQCAQGCPQTCAAGGCQPQCCSGGQQMQGQMQPSPYGYQQQTQAGRNYQTGLASPGTWQGGQSYAQGLAGNAAYQDSNPNDIYDVHIPSAFERLKAQRKTNQKYKPSIKTKPKKKNAAKRYRHRFYDKEGNPHDEIVYDGARCDPSCTKLCEPSCRFECCVGLAAKKTTAKKVSKYLPVPTLVSPVQHEGKLTYPYADVTPAPGEPSAQTQPPADTQAGSQTEQPAQPDQPAQEGQPEESSDQGIYGRPSPYGAQYGQGGMYGNQRAGQYGQPYPGQQGQYTGQLGMQGQYGGYQPAHGGHLSRHGQAGYQGQHAQGYPPQPQAYPPQQGGYLQQGYPGYPGGQQGAASAPASYAQGLSEAQNQQQCPAPCPQACVPSCSQQCCSPILPPPQQCGAGCASTCAPACAPKCCWDRRSKIPKKSH